MATISAFQSLNMVPPLSDHLDGRSEDCQPWSIASDLSQLPLENRGS